MSVVFKNTNQYNIYWTSNTRAFSNEMTYEMKNAPSTQFEGHENQKWMQITSGRFLKDHQWVR
ncbi:unnamed protein product, partial [Larinioides sclopetarius]